MEIISLIMLSVTVMVASEMAFDPRDFAPGPPFKPVRYIENILEKRIKQEERYGQVLKPKKYHANVRHKWYDEPQLQDRFKPKEHRVPFMATHAVELDMGENHKAILPFESNDRGDVLPFISPSDEVLPFVEPPTGVVPIQVKSVKNDTEDAGTTKKEETTGTKQKVITTQKKTTVKKTTAPTTQKKKTKGTSATSRSTADPEESYYVQEYGTLTLPGYPTPNHFKPWKIQDVRKIYGMIAKPFAIAG